MVAIRGGHKCLGLHGFLDDLVGAFIEPTQPPSVSGSEFDDGKLNRYELGGPSRLVLESRGLCYGRYSKPAKEMVRFNEPEEHKQAHCHVTSYV